MAAFINYSSGILKPNFVSVIKLKHMKNLKLLTLLLISVQLFGQQNKPGEIKANEGSGLYISGGSHLGFWSLIGQQKIPYNFQIDKSFSEDFTMGIGYTHDEYIQNPTSWTGAFENTTRDNLHLRFYHFLSQKKENFRSFVGGAVGFSIWQSEGMNSKVQKYPSAQFIYGFRIKISEHFFNQTEFAIGPPCAFKTSIGINF